MSLTITAFNSRDEHRSVPCEIFKFSGGEVQVRLDVPTMMDHTAHDQDYMGHTKPTPYRQFRVLAHVHSSDDFMAMLLACDALHQQQPHHVELICPYLPYARQDRACHEGEAFSLSVILKILNGLNFRTIQVWDPHSDKINGETLGGLVVVPAADFVAKIKFENEIVVVAPDKGARGRAHLAAERIGAPLVQAEKTRNSADGKITGTVVHCGHMGDQDFLMVDDICDGGRTFIELAKVLRAKTNGKILLYVTHAIFSNGLDSLREHIDHIYTPNPFNAVSADFVTVIR